MNPTIKKVPRIVIDLKRDAVANVVINQLYKFTELQTSYGINNVAIGKRPPEDSEPERTDQ